MTIENANKARVLLDEKECLEEVSSKLEDFMKVSVDISVTNPSPHIAWARDYIKQFMTEDVISRMRTRITEIEKEIGKL